MKTQVVCCARHPMNNRNFHTSEEVPILSHQKFLDKGKDVGRGESTTVTTEASTTAAATRIEDERPEVQVITFARENFEILCRRSAVSGGTLR
jgi:hypothetical protein